MLVVVLQPCGSLFERKAGCAFIWTSVRAIAANGHREHEILTSRRASRVRRAERETFSLPEVVGLYDVQRDEEWRKAFSRESWGSFCSSSAVFFLRRESCLARLERSSSDSFDMGG